MKASASCWLSKNPASSQAGLFHGGAKRKSDFYPCGGRVRDAITAKMVLDPSRR